MTTCQTDSQKDKYITNTITLKTNIYIQRSHLNGWIPKMQSNILMKKL